MVVCVFRLRRNLRDVLLQSIWSSFAQALLLFVIDPLFQQESTVRHQLFSSLSLSLSFPLKLIH
jgi:hypothetical protein